MKELSTFILSLKGIATGVSNYRFDLDDDFFNHFPNALIGPSEIPVEVSLDKRPSMIIVDVSHGGFMETDCDRCMERIQLPLQGSRQYIVKFVDQLQEDEDEVIFMERDAEQLNLAPIIYEAVTLSLPLVKVYDCESDPDAPCNYEVLDYLDSEEEDPKDIPTVWDDLKNLKL